jgi:hypothetical protein
MRRLGGEKCGHEGRENNGKKASDIENRIYVATCGNI